MSPTERWASGRSTRSSTRRSSSRMATRVSRGLPLISISRFKAGTLDPGRPAAPRDPDVVPAVSRETIGLGARARRRGGGGEQPERSRSPMHVVNLSDLVTYVNRSYSLPRHPGFRGRKQGHAQAQLLALPAAGGLEEAGLAAKDGEPDPGDHQAGAAGVARHAGDLPGVSRAVPGQEVSHLSRDGVPQDLRHGAIARHEDRAEGAGQ